MLTENLTWQSQSVDICILLTSTKIQNNPKMLHLKLALVQLLVSIVLHYAPMFSFKAVLLHAKKIVAALIESSQHEMGTNCR